MPYLQICRANPDDGLWHDPTASGKTRCGKDSGKSQLSSEGRASDKTIITHANACTGCYPFLKSNADLERTARSDGTLQDFVGNSNQGGAQ